MAPPTKIVGVETQQRMLDRGKDCVLKSLIQNECSFRGDNYVCTPFKRVFERCTMRDGRVVNVEVTTQETNS